MLANLTPDDVKYFRGQMERWVHPSHGAMRRQLDRIRKLHGLAAIEAELRVEERKIEEGIYSDRFSVDPVQWVRILTISELWVMGAYEFVRRWHDLTKAKNTDYSKQEIEAIARLEIELTRVRIPLAKEETPKHRLYRDDPGQVFPGYWKDGRVGWTIKENVSITRAELADQFIKTLEFTAGGKGDSTVRMCAPDIT